MSAARPSVSSSGTDALFRLVLTVLAVAVPFANVAWLGGNLATILSRSGRWAPYAPTAALLEPERLWPETSSTVLTLGRLVVPTVVTATAVAVAGWWWVRHRATGRGRQVKGLATAPQVKPLLLRPTAAKARQLRPSLAARPARRLTDSEIGIRLGDLAPGHQAVFASFEDVGLAIMAPRSGKTTSLAVPAILSAPGAVLLTSNKAANDAYTVTLEARAAVGTVWTLDPQQIARAPRELWWNILAEAATPEGAQRLAGHFVTATISESDQDFWSKAAQNTLTSMFLAAANTGLPVTDVLAWLAAPADRTPIDALKDIGEDARADQLEGTVAGAAETRDGIFETARQFLACLLDPAIAAWVTPHPDVPEFRPEDFATSRDTLYLLSKDGGGGASGIIAAAADSVMRAAVRQAERDGGRLDPPMICVLDEAANVCKIADLPDLYSHLGSRGVLPLTILQSYRQGQRVWGDTGMDALWSASTIKIIGSGIDDPDFADKLSRLIGDHEVETLSHSHSEQGRSTSISTRTERILPPDRIRALPKGQGLLLATGLPVALLTLKPWYQQPDAPGIAAASRRQTALITTRVLHPTGPNRPDAYEQAA
ncbi:type IV secretory system conjugative DNA transfer family protein [Streptomyces sp. NPDC127098]|uniref:type IV secretory system conjugative DNA transfer family protein n=1 Tax=Streptomyces sp. NPDC127098 TaxID=3347137 RepID=UPI0036525CE7